MIYADNLDSFYFIKNCLDYVLILKFLLILPPFFLLSDMP